MSFSGELGSLSVVDLVQLLSTGGHSGRLSLTRGDRHAEIAFFRGRIFSAWGGGTTRVGELLLARGAIDSAQLEGALARQDGESSARPLGKILIEAGAITTEQLYAAVEEHIKGTMAELACWSDGTFAYVDDDSPPVDETRFLPSEVIPQFDLDTQTVILDAMRMFDERGLDASGRAAREVAAVPPGGVAPGEPSPDVALRPDAEGRLAAQSYRWAQDVAAGGEHPALVASALCHQLTTEPQKLDQAAVACLFGLAGGRRTALYAYWHSPDVLERVAVHPPHADTGDRALPLGALDLPFGQAGTFAREDWGPKVEAVLRERLGALPEAILPVAAAGVPYGVFVVTDKVDRAQPRASDEVLQLFQWHLQLALTTARLHQRSGELHLKDPLTRLFNHRYFQVRLYGEISHAQRHGHPLTIMLVDVDDLRRINEERGRTVGDQVLVGMGDLIYERCRASDIVARYDGGSFALILPETTVEGGRIKAERVRAAVAETVFYGAPAGGRDPVTVSIGIAEYPSHAVDGPGLVTACRHALREAKQSGTHQVAIASPVAAPPPAAGEAR